MKRVVFVSDHAGYELKQSLISKLSAEYQIVDMGPSCGDAAISYASQGYDLAEYLIGQWAGGDDIIGVAICGTGIGISIALNRYSQIRAARVTSSDDARLAREHNNANVLALGGRQLSPTEALTIVRIFLTTDYQGGRHEERVCLLGARGYKD